MDNVTIPDGMPALKWGSHSIPSRGSCVMEYCSVLLGQEFTDHPAGINHVIATYARGANDEFADTPYGDAARSEFFAPIVPRILACTDTEWMSDHRAVWAVYDRYRDIHPYPHRAALLDLLDRYEADHPQAPAVRLPGVTAEAIGVV